MSFASHVARGVIRDASVRRKAMIVLLVAAVLMVLVGSTILTDVLNPREHVARFLVFWLGCGWLTLTVLLLAAFDMLAVRAQARAARAASRKEFLKRTKPLSKDAQD
ncbi:MAG: hypothetical protein ABR526_08670 [Chthoniobacterales bacterium]